MKRLQLTLVELTPLWLLILSPFLLFPNNTRFLALLGIPVLWTLSKWVKGYFVCRTPLDWAILLILLMVLVSLYATFDIRISLAKLCGLLFHIAIFYAVVDSAQTVKGLHNSLLAYLLVGIAVSAFGLVNTAWLLKIELLNIVTRRLPVLVRGLPGAEDGLSPNQLAGTLIWIFPILIVLFWSALKKQNRIHLILRLPVILISGLAFVLFTFLLTQSRGGWLGGVVAIVLLGVLAEKRLRRLALVGLIVAAIAFTSIGWDKVGDLLVSDTTEAVVGNLNSLEFRQEVWQVALWGIADFPFTGMGLGTFREVARLLYPLNVSPSYDIAHAHNIFLQTALDLGIPGLVAYISLWLGSAFMLWRVLRHTDDHFIKWLAIGASSCMAGYFVYGISDAIAFGAKPGIFFWWLLGIIVALYKLVINAKSSVSSISLQLEENASNSVF